MVALPVPHQQEANGGCYREKKTRQNVRMGSTSWSQDRALIGAKCLPPVSQYTLCFKSSSYWFWTIEFCRHPAVSLKTTAGKHQHLHRRAPSPRKHPQLSLWFVFFWLFVPMFSLYYILKFFLGFSIICFGLFSF